MSPLFRSRDRRAEGAPPPAQSHPPPRRLPAPSPGQLRRERRALLRLREERIYDLGGLVLEMVRRDDYREGLVFEACAEVIGIEARLHEVQTLLSRRPGRRELPACTGCGAALPPGARFCASCGHAVGAATPGAQDGSSAAGSPAPPPDVPAG